MKIIHPNKTTERGQPHGRYRAGLVSKYEPIRRACAELVPGGEGVFVPAEGNDKQAFIRRLFVHLHAYRWECPWRVSHRLSRIAAVATVEGKKIEGFLLHLVEV